MGSANLILARGEAQSQRPRRLGLTRATRARSLCSTSSPPAGHLHSGDPPPAQDRLHSAIPAASGPFAHHLHANAMRPLPFFISLAALLPALFAATPAEELLPPAAQWHGASEALIVPSEHPWITPAERSQLRETPTYHETIDWLRRLADASPLLSLHEFGHSVEGRPLLAVVASRAQTHSAEALRTSGQPILLVQAGIHSGEIDGKDAGMMLLRDIAFGGKAALLDAVHFLFVPVLNVDGHERASEWNRPNQRGPERQGWRTTAQNLNLNRDYIKADAPEMRAMLRLIAAWQPTLYLDLHVTDGIDYQYDVTFGYNGAAGEFAWSPHIAGWLERQFRPAVSAALRQAGHVPGPLVWALDDRNLYAGLSNSVANPRYSTGYGDLRHLPTVLVENHSLKPYRQRVLGTYVLLEATLQLLARESPALRNAVETDRAGRSATLALNWGNGGGERRYLDFLGIEFETYPSPASGTREVRWTGRPKTYDDLLVIGDKPGLKLPRPKAYWVPVSKPDVIARLELHGIQYETLTSPRQVEVQMYRLGDPVVASTPFEARHLTSVRSTRAETRQETFLAGSARIPTDQPLGDLAIALLEPMSADSLFAWGFFSEILQRTEYIEGYVIAPLADRMLEADPALRLEFEKKLLADPAFAGDPQARLGWFYAKTKFYDDRFLLYPVGVER